MVDKGIHDFDLFYKNYLDHNTRLWERYRNGHIRQDELRIKRMWLTLLDFKVADEDLAQQLNELFLQLLPTRTLLFPDTKETLDYLNAKGYALHLITNGFDDVQHSKLKHSGLSPYFEHVITSENSNSLKPKPEIFEFAFQKTGAGPGDSIMIGDTMDIDIEGAKNVGMDQVHVNYNHDAQAFAPTYTVYHLKELREIL